MSEKSQIKAGAVLSYVNLLLGSVLPFLYTPLMLKMLGQLEYGLYSLSTSIVAYLSLLNFGLGSTIVRYVTQYRIQGEKEKEEFNIGSFLYLYAILAGIVILFGVSLSIFADRFFAKGLSGAEIHRLRILLVILSCNMAITFVSSVFSSIVISHEKYIFRRILDLIITVATPILNLTALYLGFASVAMACVSMLVQLSLLPVYLAYCKRKLNLHIILQRPNKPFLTEIWRFSVFIFIGSLVDMFFWATDKVLLGSLVGTVAVAVYNIGAMFNDMIQQLSTAISGVLIPKITGMVVQEASRKELSDLFIRIGRIQFLIIGLVVSGFISFGRYFIHLWVGDSYEDAYAIALLTMIPLVIPLIQNVGFNIIIAQKKHGFRAMVYLVIAIANAISTYLVIPYMGGIGAALCSCIAYLIGQGLIMNGYYWKVTGIDIPDFWRQIGRIALVPILLSVITLWIGRIVDFYQRGMFVCGVVVFGLCYCLLMYLFMMNPYEKEMLLGPVRKMLRR
ncbi:MAG: lipopolysaccharide biosynthesis protein [Lachnospiraceae bacterium]|nr:lipopolysaccharide biosynthesis protein [Lachnospiraceae bacterium]